MKMKLNGWFVLGLCFLILNGVAVVHWLAGSKAPEAVSVGLAEPLDGLVEAGGKESVRWHFSADMVETNRIGKWVPEGPVVFKPEVRGEFCWNAANELSFRPLSGWMPCTAFSAVFMDGLKSVDGRMLDGSRTTAFSSAPLQLLEVRQSSAVGSGEVDLDFEFNEAVAHSLLLEHLEVRDAEGKKVEVTKFENYTRHKSLRVRLATLVEGELTVTVRKGLVSTEGLLGLEQDVVRKVAVTRNLRVLQASARISSYASGSVDVVFNAPVDAAAAKGFISVEPAVEFHVESTSAWDGRQHVRIFGGFEAGERYRITFRKGLGTDEDLRLEADDTRTVYFAEHRASVDLLACGTYLSTQGSLSIPFWAVNSGDCTVTIRRVYSNNLVHMAKRSGYYYSGNSGLDQLIEEFTLPMDAELNETVNGRLDLRERLGGQTGAFHIEMRGERGGESECDLVVSDLGLSLRRSNKDMLVWVNSIRSTDPVEGATVKVLSAENQLLLSGTTDAEGLVRLDPEAMQAEGNPYLLVVEKGDDLTYLQFDRSSVNLGGAVGARAYLQESYEAFLFTDRGVYRPGETVHCKAMVRGRDAVCPESFPVELELIRPDGKTDRTLSGMLNAQGCAEFELPMADYVATGRYRMQLKVPGADSFIGNTSVAVEEFVPPQIRTTLEVPQDRTRTDEVLKFRVLGQHLFGRAAEGMPVSARVELYPCAFAPKGWAEYQFGDAQRSFTSGLPVIAAGGKELDKDGAMGFVVKTSPAWKPPAALRAVISGTVQEVGGRSITETKSCDLDVYPSYIGIRRPERVMETGGTNSFALAVVSPDGVLLTNAATLAVRVEKLNWVSVLRRSGNSYHYDSHQEATPVLEEEFSIEKGRASIDFTPTNAGRYRLVVENPKNGTASSLEFGVREPGQRWGDRSLAAPDAVELELDKEAYRVGETARLLIHSPFAGRALLTVESDEILQHRVWELTNNVVEVELPVKAAYCPNVYCSISVVRAALPEEVWGHHRAAGRISLRVEQPEKKLALTMVLPEEMRPGTTLEIPVQVSKSDGSGCASEIVLAAVDEGICMLDGFKTPDPFDYFYGPRRPTVSMFDLYARLVPEALDQVDGAASKPGGGMGAAISKRLNPIKARRFKPVALWSASVETDGSGRAMVHFEVPEFTGQLRIMAVAVEGSRFGSAEESVLVKRPLVVQSSLPRFLAPEDVFEVPVRIYNETGRNGEVRVSVVCDGLLEGDALERRVALDAGRVTNLTFHLRAGAALGTAVCRLSAEMGAEAYSESVELAVRPAAPRTVLSGNGKVPAGTNAVVQIPGNWLEGTGESTLWLSGLPSVKLGASLDYLVRYPHGCLEQTVSGAFPLLYLSELAEQLRPGWLGAAGTTEFVNVGIRRVLSLQTSRGGFSMWPNCSEWSWGSVYAAHFLVEAKRAGYEVPSSRIDEALNALERAVNRDIYDSYNRSYACFVLALGGRPQHGAVARLSEQWDELLVDSRVNLVSAQLAAGQRRRAVELLDRLGEPAAHPVPNEVGGSLRSEVRGNAFLLSALLDMDPESADIPQLVRRLEAAQKGGRWSHTQDNAVALMALGKYTQRLTEKQQPIAGRIVWNAGAEAIDFSDREELRVALDGLKGEAVWIENRGAGDLYFLWNSEGVPADGVVEEHDDRIQIRRALFDLEGKEVDPMQLKQGELYVVRWSLPVDETMRNLVIEDLLPAGLEVENGVLKTSQSVQWVRSRSRFGMEHFDVRDDRVVAFPGTLSGDENYYFYAVRAVTVGEFVWPAISASCMYDASIESVHGQGTMRVLAE